MMKNRKSSMIHHTFIICPFHFIDAIHLVGWVSLFLSLALRCFHRVSERISEFLRTVEIAFRRFEEFRFFPPSQTTLMVH